MDELRKGSELAGTIQAGLLPEDPYIFQDFTCEGSHEACLNVGRDYYDFVPVSEHLLTVTIADVTGHGYPSGLLMVACKFILTTLIEAGIPFDERIDRINRALVKHCKPTQFITFFHAEIDPHTHICSIAMRDTIHLFWSLKPMRFRPCSRRPPPGHYGHIAYYWHSAL
ncbi:MAG TPA: hypothetical protein DIT99_12085 [Candidatus Latescibacteria bacterium]|nr:hypothetical protein [Candidatus Latescibacterota bacterium]